MLSSLPNNNDAVASLTREADVLAQYRESLAIQERASLISVLKSSLLYGAWNTEFPKAFYPLLTTSSCFTIVHVPGIRSGLLVRWNSHREVSVARPLLQNNC